jgi:hypothetical protein
VRLNPSAQIEAGRVRVALGARPATTYANGCTGAFEVKHPQTQGLLRIISNTGTDEDAQGWEHVSVSLLHRCPRWEEMHWVKRQFWLPEEVVIQLHPAEEDYISVHQYTLHLWRHATQPFPLPPWFMV